MNIIVTCKECKKDIALVNKSDKNFGKEMQKQLDQHRKQFPDHNWFDERESMFD